MDNKYISHNEYLSYCRSNGLEPNDDELNKHNEEFVNAKLLEEKDYFDNLFKKYGENINLDEEQRRIILKDDDYCLVNAGAGSGKSTTMAAKVKYLVDKLNIKPEEIIMLTFTKKSSEDLDEKVNDIFDLGIQVSTFHSLGMKFIKKLYPYPVGVVGVDEQKNIIGSYIREQFTNKVKMKDIIDLFHVCVNKSYIFKGFIEHYDKFNTFEEYFEDYKKRKYEIESKKPGGIHKYIKNRLAIRDNLYTIQGERVKSKGEMRIANYLYAHGIDYTYEKIFEEKVNEDTTYNPDFTIDYQGRKIYIEYFGLSECYNEKNELNRKAKNKYNRNRKLKEKFQSEHNYDFINLDYMEKDEEFIETLKKELSNRNVELKLKSDDEIFYRILDNNLYPELYRFIDLLVNFIDIFKNMLVDDPNYMFDKVMKNISNSEEFNYFCYSNNLEEEKKLRIKAVAILKEIYEYYQSYLISNHMIDYNDMINLSYKHIIKDVKDKYPDLCFKYVVVDEYQDITFQRFLFVKRLIEYFEAKLLSVGDDWQSIYAFNGSRLELFNQFNDMFNTNSDAMYLSTTYRYGQELADITSKFVMQNELQSKKYIKAIKNLKDPIELCYCTDFNEVEVIYNLVHKLYKENPKDKILILARTNRHLNSLFRDNYKYFGKGVEDAIICKGIEDAEIERLTMHRSKGLTADQTIVFGLNKNLFPTKGKIDHWIFEYFKLDDILNEGKQFAEERRLFYVSLTRTRNKVYLVAPQSNKMVSEFVEEIRTELE